MTNVIKELREKLSETLRDIVMDGEFWKDFEELLIEELKILELEIDCDPAALRLVIPVGSDVVLIDLLNDIEFNAFPYDDPSQMGVGDLGDAQSVVENIDDMIDHLQNIKAAIEGAIRTVKGQPE